MKATFSGFLFHISYSIPLCKTLAISLKFPCEEILHDEIFILANHLYFRISIFMGNFYYIKLPIVYICII